MPLLFKAKTNDSHVIKVLLNYYKITFKLGVLLYQKTEFVFA